MKTKTKWIRLKKVARRTGQIAKSGMRNNALQVVAGAAAGVAASFGAQKVEFLRSSWWATPAALAVVGVLAGRSPKLRQVSSALLGAAGYAGYCGYVQNTQANSQPAEAKGYDEVGLLMGGQSFRAPLGAGREVGEYEVSPSIDTIGLN